MNPPALKRQRGRRKALNYDSVELVMLMAFKSLVVVDNFYGDPLAVRNQALRASWHRKEGAQYAGMVAPAIVPDGTTQYFQSLIGRPPQPVPGVKFGTFKRSFASDKAPTDIHVDSTVWGAIVFLSNPPDPDGGLSFWQHKRYGWEWAPSKAEYEAAGFASFDEMIERVGWEEGRDRARWTEVMRVPMKFNRLVLFQGLLWHSHTMNFGDTLENCRLVQVFGFN